MLICPAISDTDPIRYRHPSPGGQFSGNILSEAMRTPAYRLRKMPIRSSPPAALMPANPDLLKPWCRKQDLNL